MEAAAGRRAQGALARLRRATEPHPAAARPSLRDSRGVSAAPTLGGCECSESLWCEPRRPPCRFAWAVSTGQTPGRRRRHGLAAWAVFRRRKGHGGRQAPQLIGWKMGEGAAAAGARDRQRDSADSDSARETLARPAS